MFDSYIESKFVNEFPEFVNSMLSNPEGAGYFFFGNVLVSCGFFLGGLFLTVVSVIFYRSISRQIRELKIQNEDI